MILEKRKPLNHHKVLVLNKSWAAIGVATLPRAITLLYSLNEDNSPKAKIITPPPMGQFETYSWADWSRLRPEEGEDGIITAREIYKIPEVILLTKYDKVSKEPVHFCRRAIWKRDNYICQYCGCRPPADECTLDHVLPRSLGGETSWTNCVLACYQCNSQKANRLPEDAIRPKDKKKPWNGPSPMRLLKTPVKPKYSLFKGSRVVVKDTWKHWLDKMYWEVPLVNDMVEDFDFSDV